MAAYQIHDNSHQAIEEYGWNPRLTIEAYADLYIRKLYRRRDPQMSELYASWLNLLGFRELGGPVRGGGIFYHNPEATADLARAAESKAAVARLLGRIQDRSELVEAISSQFQDLK